MIMAGLAQGAEAAMLGGALVAGNREDCPATRLC
jgi:hypothetical protein